MGFGFNNSSLVRGGWGGEFRFELLFLLFLIELIFLLLLLLLFPMKLFIVTDLTDVDEAFLLLLTLLLKIFEIRFLSCCLIVRFGEGEFTSFFGELLLEWDDAADFFEC